MKVLHIPNKTEALPGRSEALNISREHFVLGTSLKSYPPDSEMVLFGLGCFWGAERRFWEQDGIFTTAVAYANGITPNPLYEEVCTGMTGHNEVVLVVFEKDKTSLEDLLKVFWESHDPTQGMRQGNDIGTQYRSGIYVFNDESLAVAKASREHYQQKLIDAGIGFAITTEIVLQPVYYFAEDYHQQYLAKNPNGYCGLRGTGVSC